MIGKSPYLFQILAEAFEERNYRIFQARVLEWGAISFSEEAL